MKKIFGLIILWWNWNITY